MLSERHIARIGLVGAFAILAGSVALLLGSQDDPRIFHVEAGMPAPEVTLQGPDGRDVALSEKGHLTVLCIDSPERPAAAQDYADRLQKLINDVNEKAVDAGADGEIAVTAGPGPKEAEIVKLIDQRGEIANRFDVHLNPTFFVIDENGLIRYRGGLNNNNEDYKLTATYLTNALRTLGDGKQVTVAWVRGRSK